MSREVVAALHPPRLPEAFTAGGAADLILAFGLGLLLAALLLALLPRGMRQRYLPAWLRRRREVQAVETLPASGQMTALAALAAQRGLTLREEERAALYAPGPVPDPVLAGLKARLRRRRARG